MSWRRRWVVLVAGEPGWVERRTRELLDDMDEDKTRYTVVPGQGRYQAIVQADDQAGGPEVHLGYALSLECEEPVYCIEGLEEYASIFCYLKGAKTDERREPEELVHALGCVMPWENEPPRPRPRQRVTRRVVLIQGLSKARVSDALVKVAVRPLPSDYYCLEEVPQGLILRDGTGRLVFTDLKLARRFPRATFYSVVATPDLDFFSVRVKHNRKTSEFMLPPSEFPQDPVLEEVMGERTPERILAALGMSKEWFQL